MRCVPLSFPVPSAQSAIIFRTGQPRHMQDSRVMFASLRSELATSAATAAEARMQMQVADKMKEKRKGTRDVFVRLPRDRQGRVRVADLRDGYVLSGADPSLPLSRSPPLVLRALLRPLPSTHTIVQPANRHV